MFQQSDTSAELAHNGYIDTHVHLWTADIERYPLACGYSKEQISSPSFVPNDIFALANPLGVDRMVLIQMVFYGFDNSYMLECIGQHPDVFAGVAVVDERRTDLAAEMRRLRPLGVRGVRISPIHSGINGWLDSPGMQMLWATATELRLTICPLIDPDELPGIDRMCRAFPDVSVAIDHCARIGGDGQFHEQDVRQLCDLAKHQNTFVKLSAFYFLGLKRPPYDDVLPLLRRIIDAFGPERLMWGSDSPFQAQSPQSFQASLKLVTDRLSFVSQSERHWILERTAASLFFT